MHHKVRVGRHLAYSFGLHYVYVHVIDYFAVMVVAVAEVSDIRHHFHLDHHN